MSSPTQRAACLSKGGLVEYPPPANGRWDLALSVSGWDPITAPLDGASRLRPETDMGAISPLEHRRTSATISYADSVASRHVASAAEAMSTMTVTSTEVRTEEQIECDDQVDLVLNTTLEETERFSKLTDDEIIQECDQGALSDGELSEKSMAGSVDGDCLDYKFMTNFP